MRAGHRHWASASVAVVLIIALSGACSNANPTASPAPIEGQSTCPTPSCGSSQEIVVDEAAVSRHLDALQAIADANGGERSAGSAGYAASVEYVVEQMDAFGYDVTRDPFDFTSFRETAPTTLTIGDQTWTSPSWVRAQLYSPAGDVTANVELPAGVGGCQ